MRILLTQLILVLGLAGAAFADSPLPDKRIILHRDADYPGGDLQTIFDTTIDTCENACLSRGDCAVYTYNSRSGACFLKDASAEKTPYSGAFSGVVVPVPATVLASAGERLDRLDFLTQADLDGAARRAADLPHEFTAGGWRAEDLIGWAREAEDNAEIMTAMQYIAVATVLTDAAYDWAEYARLANAAAFATENSGEKRTLFQTALEASIAAFLRAEFPMQEVTALQEMATALEKLGRGRAMIPALRLAENISPRADIAEALERAIGLYGFRVTDSLAQAESASPRICAEFSEALVPSGVDYTPFVQMDVSGFAVSTSGKQLCVEGITHGARYTMTLRAGLPAESGEVLAKPVRLNLYVRDRTASVHFPGRAYVLPALEDAGLPIVGVNAEHVELSLSRLSDRNLVRAHDEGYFGRSLDQWDMDWLDKSMTVPVWEGEADIAMTLNEDVTSRLPIGEALVGQAPGIYVLNARVPGLDLRESPSASQWFLISDIGLSTMMGADGLHVFARALTSAAPLEGVEVELASRANSVLGTAVTDARGYAHFPAGVTTGPGSAAPAIVTAKNGADVTFLSLTGPAFDLSDRGVEGRAAPPPVDVFLTTDRGAYRAGETVHVTALARDGQAEAIDGLPLVAVLTRPDGVEYSRHLSNGAGAGGHVFALPLAGGVPRGTWRLDIHADPDAPALASETLLVEDFLPERLEFDLALDEGPVQVNDRPTLNIDARYLFGAPGADLAVEGDVRLRATRTLDAFPGYLFGPADDVIGTRWGGLDPVRTDASGRARAKFDLPEADEPGIPFAGALTVRVKEGSGRPVERNLDFDIAPLGPVIGVRPGFDGALPEGTEASFSLIALSEGLAPIPMQTTWELNRVETHYQWYSTSGNWFWEPTTTRERIASGEVSLGRTPLDVAAHVDWGQYELVVTQKGGDYVSTTVEFNAGWYAAASSETTPDMLDVSLDAERYAPGDTATLRFVPRDAGTVLVSVVSNRLIDMVTVQAQAGENTVTLPVTAEWGAGAYVTATLLRPLDSAEGRGPNRALGLAHASVDPGDHALDATLDVAAEAAPRGPLDVTLTVAGARDGERVFATVAAVDVGILNLTSFAAPDPSGHYFGQQRLGMELRDLYGRLIDGRTGAMGRIRSGGDAMAMMRMQAPPPTEELVAQFSGLVEVVNGQARVSFDMPEFNGTVRLMAVVWSDDGVGEAQADVLVRDPIVMTASLPRFLSPGDEARMLLELTHAKGPAGEVRLTAMSDALPAGGRYYTALELAEHGTARLSVPIRAGADGVYDVALELVTPDGTPLTKTLKLPVEALDPETATTLRVDLPAGRSFELTRDIFAGLTGARATVTGGPLARIDTAGLIDRLDRYPYGCTEQQASRALPLLYLGDVADAMGLEGVGDAPKRVRDAITGVLANQASSGSFGVWRPDSGDLWLDAYASDFLSRARAQGYEVPDTAFRAAMDNLRNRVNYYPDFEEGGEDLAYALYVLAREGATTMGDLRYHVDVKGSAFTTPLGAAQLGAALAAYGDPRRADAMFARASQQLQRDTEQGQSWRDDYGTSLRDAAAVLALAVEAGSKAVDREALLARLARATGQFSTQEAAWSLLAVQAMLGETPGAGLTVDGVALTRPLVDVLTPAALSAPRVIANTGREDTELTLTVFGVPEVPPAPTGHGYAIERRYFTLEGEPVDPSRVKQGDRLVTLVTVTPWEYSDGRLMITDPLPAGFEIDNPTLLRSGDVTSLDWLDVLEETEMTQFRQDRFLAAVNWTSDKPIRLGYVVRAVTPGVFHHPATSVEDMYRPAFRAVGAAGQVVITE